jgi:uncharacterized glyoxalase superfamily protein PhnB
MTAMDITMHASFLPHDDPGAALAFYRGPADQPGTSIVLHPPAVDPGILATKDLDDTFERVQASGAEVVQEPTEQPYGVRDCAFRDPAGNLIRIQHLR